MKPKTFAEIDAQRYRDFVVKYCEKLGVPLPIVHVNELDPLHGDGSWDEAGDHFIDGVIWYYTPYWEWNAAHEFAHYIFWLAREGRLELEAEENFVEFFIHEPTLEPF